MLPAVTNSQPHCEACQRYRCSINLKLGQADRVSMQQSEAWHPTVSWSPVINISFCKQQTYRSNKTIKTKVFQFLVQCFPFHISLFNLLIEFSTQWKIFLPLTRLKLSTANFLPCPHFTARQLWFRSCALWKLMSSLPMTSGSSEFPLLCLCRADCCCEGLIPSWDQKCCSNNY